MANATHLSTLKQGVKAWNSWRKQKRYEIQPNLSGASLSGMNLLRADLSGAKLSRADLSGAKLSRADLSEADLRKADLSEARLSRANLTAAALDDADLSWADLNGANLFKATLSRANLCEARLSRTTPCGADLSEANLSGANLAEADLSEANLFRASLFRTKLLKANLSWANLSWANLSRANVSEANFFRANLHGTVMSEANLAKASIISAVLSEADLTAADLTEANLTKADFSGADLSEGNLSGSTLVKTNLERATLTGCRIYGISAWDLKLEGAEQDNLIIGPEGEPIITVDNLEVAQVVYLLLTNEKIRDVIDTIGEKGVLILGRFTEERKAVLDVIRDRLRELGFVPMMFDFARPAQRDFSETIRTLAGLSRFIIADITNPRSSPLELQATMPDYMIPFVPIIHEDEEPFAMFRDLKQKYGEWVLDVLEYDSAANLLQVLDAAVVRPALDKANQLILKKAEAIRTRHIKDYQ